MFYLEVNNEYGTIEFNRKRFSSPDKDGAVFKEQFEKLQNLDRITVILPVFNKCPCCGKRRD